MRKLILFAIVAFFVLAKPMHLNSCTCGTKPPLNDEVCSADDIFLGEVIEIEPMYLIDPSEIGGVPSHCAVTFVIHEVWKGPADRYISLITPSEESACGFSFAVGHEYLVFSWYTRVNRCSRTSALSGAGATIEQLGSATVIEQ